MEDLLQKIKKIEALIAGAKTDGEKSAAMSAKDRILKKYPGLEIHKNPVEYRLRQGVVGTKNYWWQFVGSMRCVRIAIIDKNIQRSWFGSTRIF